MSSLRIEGPWPAGGALRRWPLLALLAAAHLAVLGLLGAQLQARQQGQADRARPAWASVTLWLRPAEPARPREKLVARPRRASAVVAAPTAVTHDLPPGPGPAASPSGTPEPATGSATTAGSTTGSDPPLRIELPKPGKAGQFTQFHNPALSDPRSNTRLRLTLEEKMAVALGTVACILEERQPDGSTWRGGGRLITVPSAIVGTGAAAAGAGPAASVTQCVR